MLCVHCESQTESEERCDECGETPLVDGRFRILEVLGRGATATTYRAESIETGQQLALKELLVRNADSLKTLELFEREATVLEQLRHPNIPRYIDEFTVDLGPNIGMYLAQEFVDGTSLDDMLGSGPLPGERVFEIVRSVSETLAYLGSLSPPVIHRDLKPGNLIEGSDGSIALIDFGAVADVLGTSENGVPTMAGTLGFMAPEQLQGRTEPSTDVYGLAATAIALLTGDPPKVGDDSWGRELPKGFRVLLKRMLGVTPQNRPRPSEIVETLKELQGVFEHREQALVRHEGMLTELAATPRPIPHNFDHRPMDDGIIPVGIVILGMIIGLTFVPFGGVYGLLVPIAVSLLIGAIVFWFGRAARARKKLFRIGSATVGRFDGWNLRQGARSGVDVYFTFQVDGRRVRGKSLLEGRSEFDADDGDDVIVIYDPDRPTRNEILAHYLYGMETLS